jgi:hypothetical protein
MKLGRWLKQKWRQDNESKQMKICTDIPFYFEVLVEIILLGEEQL